MIQIYTFDALGVFAGVVTADPMGEMPAGTLTPPSSTTGTEVARWTGDEWAVLPERPVPPPAPAPQIPQAVTMRQARLALLGAGLLSSVNTAVASMPGPQGEAARIEWEFSREVRRTQPLVLAMGPMLGLTDAQLDALFVAAAAL